MFLSQTRYISISLLLVLILIFGLKPNSPVAAENSRWHITMHREGRIADAV
jgi:hypothetical protein